MIHPPPSAAGWIIRREQVVFSVSQW